MSRRRIRPLRAALAGGALIALAGASSALGAFSPPQVTQVPPTGNIPPHPSALVQVDLNNDGRLDVATANSNTDNVGILLQNANGTFTALASPAVGYNPLSIAAGDLDGDGNQDLVVGDSDGNITVLYGNGAGGVSLSQTYTDFGCDVTSVTVAEFTGDSLPDIVFGDDCGFVNLYKNLGARNFSFWDDDEISGGAIIAVDVADMDGDGIADIVSADDATPGNVYVTLGSGAGFLDGTDTTAYPAGFTLNDIAVGDLDGTDGPDVAVVGNNGAASTNTFIQTLSNDGTGGLVFEPGFAYFTASLSSDNAVALGDLNNDGTLDAAISVSSLNVVKQALNSGTTWTFGANLNTGPAPGCTNATRPSDVDISDFNNDGLLDIATADFGTGPTDHTSSGSACDLKSNAVSVLRQLAPAPTASVSPSTVSFGSVAVGSSSGPTGITLTNNGPGNLNVSSVSLSGPNAGDFSVTNTCSGPVPASGTCSAFVTFTPTGTGTRTATLTFTDNAGTQTVSLAGNGTPGPPPPSGLTVVKSGPGTASRNSTITYKVKVNNTGATATGTSFTDVLPAGLTNITATPNLASRSCSVNQGTRTVTCNLQTLVTQQTVTITAKAPNSAATLNNTASVTTTNKGSATSNTVTTTVP
jgi:uncharacterized repeat protein (TIGR01451 family)